MRGLSLAAHRSLAHGTIVSENFMTTWECTSIIRFFLVLLFSRFSRFSFAVRCIFQSKNWISRIFTRKKRWNKAELKIFFGFQKWMQEFRSVFCVDVWICTDLRHPNRSNGSPFFSVLDSDLFFMLFNACCLSNQAMRLICWHVALVPADMQRPVQNNTFTINFRTSMESTKFRLGECMPCIF